MTRRYTVLLEWDAEGPGYAVTVPALLGCYTYPEALERAREAIGGHIAALRETTAQPVPGEDAAVLLTVVDVEMCTLPVIDDVATYAPGVAFSS